MMKETLRHVQQGIISVEEVKRQLATYENLGFAKVDYHRKQRQGFLETNYGANVRRIYDVGVAGIHSLLDHMEEIQQATISVVVDRYGRRIAKRCRGHGFSFGHCSPNECWLGGCAITD